jgi:hypothetical protein
MSGASQKKRFAVIDCEDAPKWTGHHHIWIASIGCDRESWYVNLCVGTRHRSRNDGCWSCS